MGRVIVYLVPGAAEEHARWTPRRHVQQISNCELFNWLDLDATHSNIRTRWWLPTTFSSGQQPITHTHKGHRPALRSMHLKTIEISLVPD